MLKPFLFQQVPNISAIRTEYELYTYLKDGTELCRMIGLVSQGRVLEGIVYRPNNISALEEKNLTLFLRHVNEEIGLMDIFGGLGSKVFQKFSNFYVTLSGLARLSGIIEKKYGIPRFHSSGKKTQSSYEENNFKTNEIQGFREEALHQFMNDSEPERSTTILKNVKLECSQTKLDFAFEELIGFNAQYLNEVVGALVTYEKENGNGLLKREFFPVFQLQKLKTFHARLQLQLEKLQYCYTDIGRVFDDVKDDFIIYSKIVAQMKLVMAFYADQMSENPDVIDAVKRMEQKKKLSIKELTQMIPQSAMRWPMLLESIWKKAYKESRTDVEGEARRAHQLVADVFAQMDRVSADVQYKEAMREFALEVEGCDDLTEYGVLVKKHTDVWFAQGVFAENFKPFELLIFDKCVVALELKPKRVTKKKTFGGKKTVDSETEKERTFRKTFCAKEFDIISSRETASRSGEAVLRSGGDETFLWIKKIQDMRPLSEKSFVLKLPAEQAAEVEAELRRSQASVLAKIQEGSKHQRHAYRKYKGRGDLDECGLRCGECRKLMQGLFFNGIQCDTCQGIFHTLCFSAVNKKNEDVDEDEETDLEDPIYNIIQKRFDLAWEDFFVPCADKLTARKLLRNRMSGAFLVIKTEAGMTLIVKTINTGELASYEINTVKIDGETLFYIEKGKSATNIVDLISIHRRSHRLCTPIKMRDSCDSFDDYDVTLPEVTKQEEPDEDNLEAHSNYFWGEMTAAEAQKKLREAPPGTFLLRKNRDNYKLSWKNYLSKLMHGTIESVDGGFQLMATNFIFNSLHQLASFFQIQPQDQKVSLGSPLIKDPSLEEGTRFQRQQSFKIPSFQGTMSSQEAEQMLMAQPDGTYVVRKPVYVSDNSLATHYRISYKHKDKVSHLKLVVTDKGYSAQHSEGGEITAPSLSRMVDKLKFRGLFESPLHGLRRSTVGSGREVSVDARIQKPRSNTCPATEYVQQRNEVVEEDQEREELTFLHNLNNMEVKGMLANKPEGAWILYYTRDNLERIAYKSVDKVVHIKIFRVSSGFSLKQDDKKAVALEVLIGDLETEGKLKDQITQYEDTDDEEE